MVTKFLQKPNKMIFITLKLPTISVTMDNSTMTNYCQHCINVFSTNSVTTLSDCGAIWLYNKLSTKISQPKCTIKIPLEYAMMLKNYYKTAKYSHDLERIALFNIYEQIDKKTKL